MKKMSKYFVVALRRETHVYARALRGYAECLRQRLSLFVLPQLTSAYASRKVYEADDHLRLISPPDQQEYHRRQNW